MEYKGYCIRPARPSGGKRCTGYNKTTTMQIIKSAGDEGYYLIKHFVYDVGNQESKKKAIGMAKLYIDKLVKPPNGQRLRVRR